MTPVSSLGDLQQLTMLAVARLGDRAYGGAIRDEMLRVAGREVSISTVYVTLVRLENQRLVVSHRERNAPAGRGGKPRRYFQLTPQAWEALQAAREAYIRMWRGLTPVRP
jgi:DNA-binding PadR family transcriptional regulator